MKKDPSGMAVVIKSKEEVKCNNDYVFANTTNIVPADLMSFCLTCELISNLGT